MSGGEQHFLQGAVDWYREYLPKLKTKDGYSPGKAILDEIKKLDDYRPHYSQLPEGSWKSRLPAELDVLKSVCELLESTPGVDRWWSEKKGDA